MGDLLELMTFADRAKAEQFKAKLYATQTVMITSSGMADAFDKAEQMKDKLGITDEEIEKAREVTKESIMSCFE